MNKLSTRLILAFTAVVLAAVLTVVAAGAIIQQFDNDNSANRFAERILQRPNGFVEILANYYREHNSWAGVEPIMQGAQAGFVRTDFSYVLLNADQQVIFHIQHRQVGRSIYREKLIALTPIVVNSQTVGYVGFTPNEEQLFERSPVFLRDLARVLLIVALVGGAMGLILGVVMSRSVTAPLNNLANAAKAIGARHLNQRVEETGTVEMIAVARAFNEMASDLQQGEQLRRNLLADVAHELRTPLSVLQGNLRAILDEVYPLNLEETARLYDQTRLLSRLVNDLHELAQAEAHQLPLDLQPTNVTQLLQRTADTFRPNADEKGVALCLDIPPQLPAIRVDPIRISQVLHNLLGNALRHTPTGGEITLSARAEANTVTLLVADTGDGIPPHQLPNIFERFYRTDPARSRDRGGAGLGLAIARALVEAHAGQISAASTGVPGQGSVFSIYLPVSGQ